MKNESFKMSKNTKYTIAPIDINTAHDIRLGAKYLFDIIRTINIKNEATKY